MINERLAIKKGIRDRVIGRFGGRCAYCGELGHKLQVDHIKPVAAGGTNEESNLLPACPQCNNFKGPFSLEGFRLQLSMQVTRAAKVSVNFRMAKKYRQVIISEKPIVFYFERSES